ncbi:putative transposase [Phocaeicola vulgatus]|nr:putative transposase [Phocaeicola vulgatus]
MFKSYTSNDNLLLPPCLGDFIPQNDPVRVVHRIIEQINLEKLYRRYSPQGCSAYHPRMMLQILVYAYLRNIYSSRRIEEFCRNDIRFMWLTGNVTPDHNTINRFRSSRLKDVLKTIFATIVKFLVAEGFVSLDVACTDGTKMEADANRYTFVWGKSIHTRISRIAEQLEEIWQYAESVTKQELRDSAPITYQDITPEKVEKALCQIDDALNGVDADRKMKAKVRRVRKSWPEQLRKYESQGKILDGRNSYSKTDNDATFMRMKEDHMRNGQLKPGYNPQSYQQTVHSELYHPSVCR